MGKIIINYEKHNKSFWQKSFCDNGFAGYLDIDGCSYKLKYNKKQHPQIIDLPYGTHQIIYRKHSHLKSDISKRKNDAQPSGTQTLDNFADGDSIELDIITLNAKPQTEITISAISGSSRNCIITDVKGLYKYNTQNTENTSEEAPQGTSSAPPVPPPTPIYISLPQKRRSSPVAVFLLLLLVLGGTLYLLKTNKIPGVTLPEDMLSPLLTLVQEILPEETTTEAADVLSPEQESKEMYVLAGGGLRLRTEPNTDSETLLVIPSHAKIEVIKIEGEWAYITYEDEFGWCSTDYIFETLETTTVIENETPGIEADIADNETDIVNKGIAAANEIIRSYNSITPNGALTKEAPTNDEILDFFHKAYNIEVSQSFSEISHVLTRVDGAKTYSQEVSYGYIREWCQGYSEQHPNLESLCDEYYSYFSDELAYSYLENDIALIDNKMYFSEPGGIGDEGVKHEFTYTVEKTTTGYNVKVVGNYYRDYENPDVITSTEIFNFPLEKEDGAWVFTQMQWMPT